MKKFKRLIAVLVCAMMMTGCGVGGSGKNSKDDKTKEIVEAAKTQLGVEEASKNDIMKFYEGDAKNEAEQFRDKVAVFDEEVIKLRKEKGSMQEQNPAKEIIMVAQSTENGNCMISIVKLAKEDCQSTFDSYTASGNALHSDDKLIVFNAHKTHCSLIVKLDDEHFIRGQISWSYVGETTEQSEYTKNLVAFFDAIGAPNPIAIVEQNADKVE